MPYIIEKMQNRLASWKGKLLNKAGRLTLASSVLSSIPTYYMQLNWLPQNICDNIDQTTRNFIWKGNNNRGVHLVNWKKIASPKNSGVLALEQLEKRTFAFLGNWFGIWCKKRIKFGWIYYPAIILMVPISFLTLQPVSIAHLLGLLEQRVFHIITV